VSFWFQLLGSRVIRIRIYRGLMPASYRKGKKVQAIQSILCCAYITIILVISTLRIVTTLQRIPLQDRVATLPPMTQSLLGNVYFLRPWLAPGAEPTLFPATPSYPNYVSYRTALHCIVLCCQHLDNWISCSLSIHLHLVIDLLYFDSHYRVVVCRRC
jgi:hypothetical protein